MNDELYDIYANVLMAARAPERAAPLMELVALTLDFGYSEELANIHNVAKDDLSSCIVTIENDIIRCAVALGLKLGTAINPEVAYRIPSVVIRLLNALTGDVEAFEDFDSLLAIMDSGEQEQLVLENMLRHIHGDEGIFMDGLIDNVEPRLFTILRNYLEAKMLENEESDNDYDAQARLVRYIRRYPNNPMVTLFANAAYKIDPRTVAEQLDWEVDVDQFELSVIYLVGLVALDSSTYEEAYAKLETRVEWLSLETDVFDSVLQASVSGLKDIYI